MNRYYEVLVLKKDHKIIFSADKVTIDLRDYEILPVVRNDQEFLAAKSADNFFWVSGGGSFLINGRYLLVVKRLGSAKINPGKISLLTGRSDEKVEHLNPSLVVRELFEEAIVFEKGLRLKWIYPELQSLIDRLIPKDQPFKLQPIKKLSLKIDKYLEILGKDKQIIVQDYYHLSLSNDINILHLYQFDVDDIADLNFEDGEELGRELCLLDLENMTIRRSSALPEMTEHLEAFIKKIKKDIIC
jgi:hypothetical protein